MSRLRVVPSRAARSLSTSRSSSSIVIVVLMTHQDRAASLVQQVSRSDLRRSELIERVDKADREAAVSGACADFAGSTAENLAAARASRFRERAVSSLTRACRLL